MLPVADDPTAGESTGRTGSFPSREIEQLPAPRQRRPTDQAVRPSYRPPVQARAAELAEDALDEGQVAAELSRVEERRMCWHYNLCNHAARRPEIEAAVVASVAKKQLWRSIACRTYVNHLGGRWFHSTKCPGNAKIRQICWSVDGPEQHVGRLDVPMNHALRVHKVERGK